MSPGRSPTGSSGTPASAPSGSLFGKQMAYIISGPLSQNPNLMQILEASVTARQDANLVDIITDECKNSAEINAVLQNLGERLISFSEKGYIRPQNFLGVGGHKVFRDNIGGRLWSIWQAGHRYFKKHGKYDFPQKEYKIRILNSIWSKPAGRLRGLIHLL